MSTSRKEPGGAKVLVTGGAGFIGSNVANSLAQEGYKLIAFDNLFLGRQENLDSRVKFIRGDITNPGDLAKAGEVDYLIHLAAASSAPMFAGDLAGTYKTNIIGHINALEYGRRVGVKKILFASTSSIYGNNPLPLTEDQAVTPPNFYSVTKLCQEHTSRIYHEYHGLEIIAFRFMSVYGPQEEHKGQFANLVSQFIWGMEKGKRPVVYGDGTQTRDITHVRDLIQAFRLAIETPKRFGFTVFNVGTERPVSTIELIALINKIMGTKLAPIFIKNPIKSGYVISQQASLEKISRELGYQPRVTLEEGIKEIIELRQRSPVPPASLSY